MFYANSYIQKLEISNFIFLLHKAKMFDKVQYKEVLGQLDLEKIE